jgi:hypothetical protein
MKYIIKESQYKLLIETKISFFQNLMNNIIDGIREDCEYVSSDTFPDDLSFSSCDEVEPLSEIKIKEFKWVDKNQLIINLIVDVYLDSVLRYDPSILLYDISHRMSKWLSTTVEIEIDEINYRGGEW